MQNEHNEKTTGAQSPGEIARAFLEVLDPTGTHFLSAFHPQTGLDHSETFAPGALGDVVEWVNSRAGRFNLYHSVNEVRADFAGIKTAKTDITHIRAVFADIDPAAGDLDAARAAIFDRLQNAPAFCKSLIVDSGGGFHGYSILGEKLAVTDDAQDWVEAQGRALAQALGGDATQNVDRILRLPGPDNIPTPGKAAKGRVKRQVTVIEDSGDRFTRAQLEAAVLPVYEAGATDKSPQIAAAIEDLRRCNYDRDGTPETLPPELRAKFDRDLADRPDLARLWRDGVKAGDTSGSGHRMALAGALRRAGGYTHEDYAHIAGAWPLAANPGDNRDEKLSEREFARAWVNSQPRTPDDWFDALADEAATGDATPSAAAATPSGARRALPVISFDEAAATAMAEGGRPLVKGLLDQGAMSVLYGPSNVGKTFISLDLAFHIATGQTWAGMKTTRCRVLYVAAEGGWAVRKRVLALQLKHAGMDASWFNLILSSVDLRDPKADLQPLINAAATVGGVGLIVIDTLSRAMAGGDENAPTDMGALVKNFDTARHATGAHLLAVHHSGKDVARGARGHTILRAATDTELEIAEGQLSVTKQRDHEGGLKRAFKLVGVRLGFDEDGDTITSATVSFVAPEEIPQGKPTAKEGLVLEAIRARAAIMPGATGVSPQDVSDSVSSNGAKMNSNTARTHMLNLARKGLLIGLGGGKWALEAEKVQSCTSVSHAHGAALETAQKVQSVTHAVTGVFA